MHAPEGARIALSRTLSEYVRLAESQGEREPMTVLMSQVAIGAEALYAKTCDTSDYEAIAGMAVSRLVANSITADIVGDPEVMLFVVTLKEE